MNRETRTLKRLGKRIRELRYARGWSQENCAEVAEMAPVYLSGIERGVRNPTVKSLSRLARAFGVPIETLFEDIDK